MQVELRRLLKSLGATAVFVTHDQDEALTMSDKVAVMNAGRIEHYADPQSVYARPRDAVRHAVRRRLLGGHAAS